MSTSAARALSLLCLFGCGSTYKPIDLDGDGYTVLEGDCWDTPEGPLAEGPGGAEIHPGAEEAWYDGVDQDCAEDSDFDQDGDGHDALAAEGDDCDDLDPAVSPGAEEIWYDGVDQDCDGQGDGDRDGDGHDAEEAGGDDCDDLDATAYPGAEEIWYDGVDEACDGGDDDDQDGDGYAAVEAGGDDCDDLDPAISPDPDVDEVWYDGIDQDCDGNDGDQDGDGYVTDGYADLYDWTAFSAHLGAGDCWDDPEGRPIGLEVLNGFPELEAADLNPAATETWYDGVDQDCALDWDFDQDGDGYATDAYPDAAGERGTDCIDGSDLDAPNPGGVAPAEAHPGATESWYDGTDQDCAEDGDYDQDADGHDAAGYGVGSDDDCDDTLPAVHPGVAETCETSYDDDCDGEDNDPGAEGCVAFYLDADGDEHGVETSACLCEAEAPYGASVADDCDDADARRNPGELEVCDDADLDEDCDGLADDLDADVTDRSTGYADEDGDGFGDPDSAISACDLGDGLVADGSDCDDGDPGVNPDASEICDDANTDEDCDGLADDADSGAVGAGTWYTDGDGDGYGATSSGHRTCDPGDEDVLLAADCDDDDAARSPGNEEVCDARDVDEDCDGLSDDDDDSVVDQGTWYLDGDDDGFGGDDSVVSCDQPLGSYSTSTDCDDADAAISPAAREICDAADTDEDCDGLADEADPSVSDTDVYYADADGDGYGRSSEDERLCEATEGYASVGGDCDDAEAARYPGADEVCGDGLVNDCEGSVADAEASCGVVGALSADAERQGSTAYDELGLTVAGAGDVDGDGHDDVLVAAPSATGGADNGAVYLLAGPLSAGARVATATAAARVSGGAAGDRLGYGLDGGLDLDGDGYDDVIIGAPNVDTAGTGAGAAFVLEGPLSGAYAMDASASWDVRLLGPGSWDAAGTGVAVLGDVNGDDTPDLLVGAPGSDDWGSLAGVAYVVHGPADGATLGDDGLFYGAPAEEAGTWVARAGDLDGDGYADALVGSPYADCGSSAECGAAVAFLGPLTGDRAATSEADLQVRGSSSWEEVGFGLAGDFDQDGDGYDDVIVGAPGYSSTYGVTGGAAVVEGSASPGTITSFTAVSRMLVGEVDGDSAGLAVAGAGDVDGDGRDEVLVGAPDADDGGGASEGMGYLLYGPLSGRVSLGSADAWLAGGDANAQLGVAVAGAGDTDADGYADLLFGAPGADRDSGSAFLVLGGTW